MLAGFNAGGMTMILTTAEEVARMVLEGVEFGETGLLPCFETSRERLEGKVDTRAQKPAEGEGEGRMKMQAVG